MVCVAQLVGVHNKLDQDFNKAKKMDHTVADPEGNIIVQHIREAAKRAVIGDPTTP